MRKYHLENSIPKNYPKELVELMIKCDQSDRTSPRDFYDLEKHKSTPLNPLFYAVDVDEFIKGLIDITSDFKYDGMYGLSYSTISLNDIDSNFKKNYYSSTISMINIKIYIDGKCYPVSVIYSYGAISREHLQIYNGMYGWTEAQIEQMIDKIGNIEKNKQRSLELFVKMCREAKNETV